MALASVATKPKNTTTRKSTPKKIIVHELLTPTNPYELLSERIIGLDTKIDSTKNELSEQIRSVNTRIDSFEKSTNSKFNLILVFMSIGFSSIFGLLSVMLSKML